MPTIVSELGGLRLISWVVSVYFADNCNNYTYLR